MRARPLVGIASLVCTLAFGSVAAAKPPDGVQIDPEVHAWFESLVRADGGHCCGAADCRQAQPGELRESGNGFQVMLDGQWVDVPDYLVVHRDYSPIGGSVICKTRYDATDNVPNSLYCVVPITGL
jgi:hypothetical protein